MIFLDYIDLYCERTASGFWNEPINALSNAAFLIAALIAWRALQASDRRGIMDYILICLAACIGVGSFLFHTYANGQTELLDVIPIWTFVILYVATTVFRISNGNHLKTLRIMLIVLVCVGVSLWATSGDVSTQDADEPALLNGSLQYLPALVALWAFSIATVIRRHPARILVISAASCFTVSLGFRTVDLMTCGVTGVGTHFMWHVLNGSMVLGLLLALIRHVPSAGK
ncbi:MULTISPECIES: ceramidase domain-containing protein [Pacificibacter]|uniref:ceramidase domain-containing protein n=1 Tax=Pacificibacter TaxID=1042323 RepID=UPI001C08C2C8|nr:MULTISPECIES: ceramidase domain-containing protein [Pacificibacter]MBU2936436.1 ceramidase domain-containing protein [Pacificibacter marinus]MDO6616523.1 ceramidase domain-containing protein [Pacificibacter sp. 1_MG-2023]